MSLLPLHTAVILRWLHFGWLEESAGGEGQPRVLYNSPNTAMLNKNSLCHDMKKVRTYNTTATVTTTTATINTVLLLQSCTVNTITVTASKRKKTNHERMEKGLTKGVPEIRARRHNN